MLSRPVKISEQAAWLENYLGQYAQANGGAAKAVANMQHLWEEIYVVTKTPRILVCYNGESSRGGFAQSNTEHRVDRQWLVVVMRGHGWKSGVAAPTADAETPFYDVVEEVRDMLRSTYGISEEFPIDYKGTRPLPNMAPGRSANVFLDAYSIEFSTANDIVMVT